MKAYTKKDFIKVFAAIEEAAKTKQMTENFKKIQQVVDLIKDSTFDGCDYDITINYGITDVMVQLSSANIVIGYADFEIPKDKAMELCDRIDIGVSDTGKASIEFLIEDAFSIDLKGYK